MIRRRNPIRIEILPRIDVSKTTIGKLIQDIVEADEARSQWLRDQEELNRQRFSVRTAERTVPWPGASNLRVPTIDKAIRRWKPKMFALLDTTPVAYFRPIEPSDVPNARRAEQYYDWMFKIPMQALYEALYLLDLMGHFGMGIAQIAWDYRTEDDTRIIDPAYFWPNGMEAVTDDDIVQVLMSEYDLTPEELDPRLIEDIRSGTPQSLEFQSTVSDTPRIIARDPAEVIVPPRCTDIEEAPFVCVEHCLSSAKLREWGRDGVIESAEIDRVLEQLARPPTGRSRRPRELPVSETSDKTEGVATTYENPDELKVWQIFTWSEWPERRRVVYWVHASSAIVLGAHAYPYPFRRWPVVRFEYELTTRRWHSARGLSKMLTALSTSINRLHNSRLDAMAVQLAPVYKWRIPGGPAPRNLRIMPGSVIPVTDMTDFQAVGQDLGNIPLLTQEEYMTRQLAEDYVGIFEASLMSPLKPQERRTAAEIEYVAQTVQGAFSLDAKLFQLRMADVHRMVWALWYEFGEEQVYYRVMGEEQPRMMLKSEVAKSYDIVPAGTPASTSRMLELSRAREAMQLLAQDQTGLVNHVELYRYYLDLLDLNLSRRILNPPQAMVEKQILMRAAQDIAKGSLQPIIEDLGGAGVGPAPMEAADSYAFRGNTA